MGNDVKRGLVLILGGLALASIVGCGKVSNANVEKQEFTYVPSYIDMELESNQISKPVVSEDALFVFGSTMDEQTEKQSHVLYKNNLKDGTTEKWPVVLNDNAQISHLAVNPDGNICTIVEYTNFDESSSEETGMPQTSFEALCISSQNGEIISNKDITSAISGNSEMVYLQHFCMDKKGNQYINVSDQMVAVLDPNNNKICEVSAPSWIMTMTPSSDGDVYISTYGQEGIELRKVDLSMKSLTAPIEGMKSQMILDYYPGATHSFLVNDLDNAVYFDIATGKTEQLFSWLDVDVNSDNIRSMGELSDGRIWAFLEEYDEGSDSDTPKRDLLCLTKTKASELQEKEIITYGTLFLNPDIKSEIINFNKSNEKYRISVKNYYSSEYDFEAGTNQFYMDIASSNCPDIIDITSVNFEQFAQKGVFEDLYPYMKKTNIVEEDYLKNVFKAYEVDGKLYGIMPQFFILTAAAKESRLGDRSGWTLQEMLDQVEKEESKQILLYGSRENALYYCLQSSMNDFIDWETGKCAFEGEEFTRILEFASQFPAESNYENGEGTSELVRSDKVLLLEHTIGSVQEYQMLSGLFGEEICFVGYPNMEKKGNLIGSYCGSMGIASKSKNKDGAWEFIQVLLGNEYQSEFAQNENGMGFPIKKSALEEQFKKCMTPTYFTDENGNKVEEVKAGWGYDDFNIDLYAATQEEIDEVRKLIESAQLPCQDVDKKLINIIIEEAAPFFSEQKTAAEATSVIQNRIQIYVSENK